MREDTAFSSSLLAKSLAGMLFLLIAMGLAIFLPFGNLTYPLAWAYLTIFFVGVLFITLYLFLFDQHLLKTRLAVGPIAEPARTQKMIQSAAAFMFVGMYILSGLDHRYRWSIVAQPFSVAGDTLCALSFVLLFYVFRQNTFLSATIEVQEQQRVISTGMYGVVRHPMYAGAILLVLCTPLALGSLWGLAPSLVLSILIGIRTIDEEHQLNAGLTGYREYCAKVRYRIIPYIF